MTYGRTYHFLFILPFSPNPSPASPTLGSVSCPRIPFGLIVVNGFSAELVYTGLGNSEGEGRIHVLGEVLGEQERGGGGYTFVERGIGRSRERRWRIHVRGEVRER